ncbi:CHRD domain-containing protein [Streptomyces sp. WAC 00631]|uniref:CHRD domain-containing protein n=1 Tax=unclassified Streptomyces TaxID=2593676 RepID=UPI000F7786FF|nr:MULTISPECIES: CHRD domain-containing protein [unclassified Streptomyces]MCC5037104.1 CHRD domain-containing protein [Streptomyces sp. WAC 00631]MCC9737708.1 CHRD domain-containing protein [Streptomyces sp. MNU89]
MTAKRTTRLAALVALPMALALGTSTAATAAGPQGFQIDLSQLNNSGASGTAMLSLDGTELTVKIESQGLTPGQPHAQHIHGSTEGHDFTCPDITADKDGDGIVTTSEGLPVYGNINISLTVDGDTTPDSGLAVDRMPVAEADGTLSYERTLTVSQDVADHIQDLHVVQHGIDPNGNNEYDFGVGKSDLDPKLPQEATAPAACGLVKGAAVGSVPAGGVETGTTASTSGVQSRGMAAVGAATLVAAAGTLVVTRRRRAAQDG